MKRFIPIFILALVLATRVHAATVSVGVPDAIATGNTVYVDILVDPDKETVNSFDFEIAYPEDVLKFKGYSAKESIIPVWIQTPTQTGGNMVAFSGIIPGGIDRLYDPEHPNSHAIKIVRLLFDATNTGTGTIAIKKDVILRNDGIGSPVMTTATDATISVSQGSSAADIPKDTTSPAPFTITISEGSLFGKTPRLAIFRATDEDDGIDYYEGKVGAGKFKEITSPYALPYRLFSYDFTVRAYDFSGNYTEQTISVPGDDSSLMVPLLFVILLLGLYLYRKRRISNEKA